VRSPYVHESLPHSVATLLGNDDVARQRSGCWCDGFHADDDDDEMTSLMTRTHHCSTF